MTEKEKEVKIDVEAKKPLTKRDVVKFIGKKMAGWGSIIITDSAALQFGLPAAKAFKHPKFAAASVIMGTMAISYGVAMKTEEYADQFIDDICDCIVMVDDFRKEVLKSKNSMTKEEAREEILQRMEEHTA